MALLKGYANLLVLYRTACGCGKQADFRPKIETSPNPRAVRRSTADRRTGYEEAEGPKEIQWLPGISPDTDRLGKKRGPGVSPALFGDFCAYKSHPGCGAGQAP